MPTKPPTHNPLPPFHRMSARPLLSIRLASRLGCGLLKRPSKAKSVSDDMSRDCACIWNDVVGDLFGWSRQCVLGGPSILQSGANSSAIDAKVKAPFRQRFSMSVNFNHPAVASIARLFTFRRPAAIARTVRSIVVVALDRVEACWSAAHVGQESVKIVEPLLADRDSATAVVGKEFAITVAASRFHSAPGLVLREPRNLVASARFDWAGDPSCGRRELRSAFTSAVPKSVAGRFSEMPNDCDSEKHTAGQVIEVRTIGDRLELSHNATLLNRDALWLGPCWRSSATRLASFYRARLSAESNN